MYEDHVRPPAVPRRPATVRAGTKVRDMPAIRFPENFLHRFLSPVNFMHTQPIAVLYLELQPCQRLSFWLQMKMPFVGDSALNEYCGFVGKDANFGCHRRQ